MTYRHYIAFIGIFLCLHLETVVQSFRYEGKVIDEHRKPLSDVSGKKAPKPLALQNKQRRRSDGGRTTASNQ